MEEYHYNYVPPMNTDSSLQMTDATTSVPARIDGRRRVNCEVTRA